MKLSEFLKSKQKISSFKEQVAACNKSNGIKPTHKKDISNEYIDNELRLIEDSFVYAETDDEKLWSKLNEEHLKLISK